MKDETKEDPSDAKKPRDRSPHGWRAAGFLSRKEVARELDVSVATVQTLEAQARLRPIRDRFQGMPRVWFAASQLVELRASGWKRSANCNRSRAIRPILTKKPSGTLAARVFEALDERKTLVEIVKETKATPEQVRMLWREWSLGFEEGEKLARLKEEGKAIERLATESIKDQRAFERRAYSEKMLKLRAKLPPTVLISADHVPDPLREASQQKAPPAHFPLGEQPQKD